MKSLNFPDMVEKDRVWEPLVEKDEPLEIVDDPDDAPEADDEHDSEGEDYPMVNLNLQIKLNVTYKVTYLRLIPHEGRVGMVL